MENNYLTETFITKKSRESLVYGLVKLAYADDKIDKAEIQIIQEIAIQVGIDLIAPSKKEIGNIKVSFDNRKQEACFFKEAIRLAIVDEHYSESEKELLKSLSEDFGWSEEEFYQLDNAQKDMHWLTYTQTIVLN